MISVLRGSGLAAVLLLAALPAFAQDAQEHRSHHPAEAGAASAAPAPEAVPGQSSGMGQGMMGPNMMRGGMMGAGTMGNGTMGNGMMGGGMMEGRGMMPMMNMMGMMGMMGARPGVEHIEGRLAFIKAELKITDAQTPEWNAFADAVRENAKSMVEMHRSMPAQQNSAKTLPERFAVLEKAITAHLDALKKTAGAVDKLYAALDPEQKKVADEIIVGPMGMPVGMM